MPSRKITGTEGLGPAALAPRPLLLAAITSQPGPTGAAAWTCPTCYALVLSENTIGHEAWHEWLSNLVDPSW